MVGSAMFPALPRDCSDTNIDAVRSNPHARRIAPRRPILGPRRAAFKPGRQAAIGFVRAENSGRKATAAELRDWVRSRENVPAPSVAGAPDPLGSFAPELRRMTRGIRHKPFSC